MLCDGDHEEQAERAEEEVVEAVATQSVPVDRARPLAIRRGLARAFLGRRANGSRRLPAQTDVECMPQSHRDLYGSAPCRDWVGHVIVCGLNAVGLRTVEQLHLAGARVVVLDDEPDERLARIVRGWGIPHLPRGAHLSEPLYDAGILGASAVVCAESTDLRTLETVLLIRDLRPEVRVVADLDNPAVAHAVEEVLRSVGVLDVAALFAPSVVEACVGRRARDILLGDTLFVAAEVIAPADATLRELYGSLSPIGVVTEADDELIACPGRDQLVARGDRVTLLGTQRRAQASWPGVATYRRGRDAQRARARPRDGGGSGRRSRASPTARCASRSRSASLLLVISTLVLHFGYQPARAMPACRCSTPSTSQSRRSRRSASATSPSRASRPGSRPSASC